MPPTNSTVSNPCATKSCCPETSHVLNVEFIVIFTFPEFKSTTSKPASLSNLKVLIPVIILEMLDPLISLTVNENSASGADGEITAPR